MAARSDWVEPLSPAELDELARACEPWLGEGADLTALTREQFVLPTLSRAWPRVRHELLDGRGFVLLRGVPVAQWGRQRCAVAFYGLGAHLGRALSQNAQGHVLGHVRDVGLTSRDPNVRIYQTRERQTFHTDSADIVGLLCLQTARRGGLSALVSSTTLYNELRARWPELAACLFEPLATDRRGEVPPGAKPYFEIPVFNWFAGQLVGDLPATVHRLGATLRRRAAAERTTSRGARSARCIDQRSGAALHDGARAGRHAVRAQPRAAARPHRVRRWPEPERRRHLLRLWLAPADARPLPAVYAQRYGGVTPGARGGVPSADGRLRAPLDG